MLRCLLLGRYILSAHLCACLSACIHAHIHTAWTDQRPVAVLPQWDSCPSGCWSKGHLRAGALTISCLAEESGSPARATDEAPEIHITHVINPFPGAAVQTCAKLLPVWYFSTLCDRHSPTCMGAWVPRVQLVESCLNPRLTDYRRYYLATGSRRTVPLDHCFHFCGSEARCLGRGCCGSSCSPFRGRGY